MFTPLIIQQILFQSRPPAAAEETTFRAVPGILGNLVAAVRADGVERYAALAAEAGEGHALPVATGTIRIL